MVSGGLQALHGLETSVFLPHEMKQLHLAKAIVKCFHSSSLEDIIMLQVATENRA